MINNELLEILKADRKARNRVSDSAGAAEHMAERLEKDRIRLEEIYSEKSKAAIEESREKHMKTLQKIEQSYREKTKADETALNALYSKKKNEWVDEIVRETEEA